MKETVCLTHVRIKDFKIKKKIKKFKKKNKIKAGLRSSHSTIMKPVALDSNSIVTSKIFSEVPFLLLQGHGTLPLLM